MRAAQQRPKDLRQEQIRNRAQLISGGGVSGDVHAEAAQLLNQAPDFRAVGGDFLGDLGAADDDGGVLHEQAHDAAEAHIGGCGWCGAGVLTAQTRGSRIVPVLADAEIMRESPQNNKRPRSLAPSR